MIKAWRKIEHYKGNGEPPIVVQTKSGHIVLATRTVVMGETEEVGAWAAVHEGEHPPCWSDGICWAKNEDEQPSDPPKWWIASATGHKREI